MYRLLFVRSSLLLAASLLFFAVPQCPSWASEIIIVKSGTLIHYDQAVEGFRSTLPPEAHVTEFLLSDSPADAKELGQSIRAAHPDLVLTVGLKASLTAKAEFPDIPVVFCLVLNPELHGLPEANMTGILLTIEPQAQLDQIKQLVPRARRIGVLHQAQRQQPFLAAATRHAASLGLELVTAPVTEPRLTPDALRTLLPQIDVLWVLPDQTVVTEQTVPLLVGATLDAKKPLFGFSSALVKRGALGALVVEAHDAGRQAGDTAIRILRGTGKTPGRLVRPDRSHLVLNLNTADFLDLRPAPEVIRMASQVFGGPGAFASRRSTPAVSP